MDDLVAITGALSDKRRVRALLALRGGELCVCQIIELLALAPSTISKHMSILKQAGLVDSRKEERWIYYRLPSTSDHAGIVQKALDFVFASLERDRQVVGDQDRLAEILRMDPEILCRNRLINTMRKGTARNGRKK